MKLMILLTVLPLSFLLLQVTQTSKQQETLQAVQRQDFFKNLNHNKHQTNITGSWIYEIHKFDALRKYSQNATCPRYDTFEIGSPGFMIRVWDFTVGTALRARDSVVAMATRAWRKCQSITMTMTAGICNGVTWMADWIWDELAWLAEWIWDGVILLAEWIWDGVMWLAEWTWNGITWMTSCILGGDTLAGKHFTVEFNYVTNVAAKFYGEYLDGHVKHVQAVVIAMTWQDVFYVMSIDLVVSFILHAFYLLASCALNFIQRRWQAYKDNKAEISAADLPPAPKKPIWRPKPKKKKKRNKNGW